MTVETTYKTFAVYNRADQILSYDRQMYMFLLVTYLIATVVGKNSKAKIAALE